MKRALLAILLLACATPLAGQFPAELAGRVLERGSERPVAGALVQVEGAGGVMTDASGAFVLRRARDGRVTVRVTRPGYAPLATEVELVTGRTVPVVFELDVAPIELPSLEVAAPPRDATGFLFERAAIERSGARTLADLVRDVPGLVVRASAGAGERVSIRGGSADEVLVLVDGVPVNDPLTGVADLSLVPLQGVSSVQVLPGARSARMGGRAQAGVIVVESSRTRDSGAALGLRAGSLGVAGAEAEATLGLRAFALAAGARFDRLDGEFEFDRPDALGGGTAARANADALEWGGFAALATATWLVRADLGRVERGLPGPVHAPTPAARQTSSRTSLVGSWSAVGGASALRADANLGIQQVRHRDPSPAIGAAYDDTTRAVDAGLRAEIERSAGDALRRTLALGTELRALRLEASALDPDVVNRHDVGVFTRGAVELAHTRLAPRLSAALRADRWSSSWIASHELALHASLGGVALDLAHRSAFTPPAASDQYFARGVGIEPNPDLEPERVRSEIEMTASSAARVAAVTLRLGASAYSADVDGMIVWTPDYRFVWRPTNRDVKRSGGEAWLRAELLPDLELGTWAALARVTYDWPGDADSVQVVYRPRHTAGATLDWSPASWTVRADALYTGVRFATPGPSNDLPGYWDVDLALLRDWTRGAAHFTAALRVQRLLDNDDAFIHGYPEAGRRLTLELDVRAADRPDNDRITSR